jgi:hypothetical protein
LAQFQCDADDLAVWLKASAHQAASNNVARTFVMHPGDHRVIGYCSLTMHSIARAELGRSARGEPSTVPAVLLGKLALDRRATGQGLGKCFAPRCDASGRRSQSHRRRPLGAGRRSSRRGSLVLRAFRLRSLGIGGSAITSQDERHPTERKFVTGARSCGLHSAKCLLPTSDVCWSRPPSVA